MQIKPQNHQMILDKFSKIKCSTGCLNNINYLVFNYGLYCTACLSKINNLTQDSFLNLATLSKIIADLTDKYYQKTKGKAKQEVIVATEIHLITQKIKRLNDFLSHDIRTVKTKSNSLLDELYTKCLRENQNTSMEALYQPDLTVTSIVNQSMLLLENLANLTVDDKKGDKEYRFLELSKKPQQVNPIVKNKYKQLKIKMQEVRVESNSIFENFKKLASI